MKQPRTPSHARTVRAQAAKSLSAELREVLGHAAVALLRIGNPDALVGLQRHCQKAFGAVSQLMDVSSDPDNSSSAVFESTSNGELKDTLEQGQGTAAKADQHQFGWLQGVALQVRNKTSKARHMLGRQVATATAVDCSGSAFFLYTPMCPMCSHNDKLL